MWSDEPVLRVTKLVQQYPGVRALDDVTLTFNAGEIVALLGENGAGKSTLIKIISGVQKPTSGSLHVHGDLMSNLTPASAQAAGIRAIHQEMNLIPALPVHENVMLENRPIRYRTFVSRGRSRHAARKALDGLGVSIDVNRLVRGLPRSTQQLIEIAKGLQGEARFLVLDEPTASLGEDETDRLIAIVRTLAQGGMSILWITHRLNEVPAVADRVAILRDGRVVADSLSPNTERDALVATMTGRDTRDLFPARLKPTTDVACQVTRLNNRHLRDVTMTVRTGEILGVAGLLGSGKAALGRAIFGLDRLDGGSVQVNGRELGRLNPRNALANGLVYYPADRRHEGLALGLPMLQNFTMGAHAAGQMSVGGFLRRRRERRTADSYLSRLRLRPNNPTTQTRLFSGGNQQKILLARGMLRAASVHIFDEPTVGIDVGARAEVYNLMAELAIQGAAVVVISSDVQELIGLCHRICAMSEGAVVAELSGPNLRDEDVVSHFFTTHEQESTN